MKVFISWSGDTSHELALALRDWLPDALQSVQPWVSSEDIAKGAFWNPALVEALKESDFGLCCLTPDNVGSPWMAFEAGAMIQRQTRAHVSPVLLGLKPTDNIGLYAGLQHTQLTPGDVKKLLLSINKVGEKPIPDAGVERAAERLWPELKKAAEAILANIKPADTAKAKRGTEAILEDVLEQLRTQSNQLVSLVVSAGSRTAPPYYIPAGGSTVYFDPPLGAGYINAASYGSLANIARLGIAPDAPMANTPLALATAAVEAEAVSRAARAAVAKAPTAMGAARAAVLEAAQAPTAAEAAAKPKK